MSDTGSGSESEQDDELVNRLLRGYGGQKRLSNDGEGDENNEIVDNQMLALFCLLYTLVNGFGYLSELCRYGYQ